MLRRCMLVSCNQLLGPNRLQVRFFFFVDQIVIYLGTIATHSGVPSQLGSTDPCGVPQHGTILSVDSPWKRLGPSCTKALQPESCRWRP